MTIAVSELIRLNKLLASWGIASRRTIDEWILAGRIKLNGKVVEELGIKVNPNVDIIELDGKKVFSPQKIRFLTLILHKPYGVLTTMKDPFGRPTVKELLPAKPRLFPVGRLDFATTGLLIVTNNGQLANRLMHPRYKIEKEYIAVLKKGCLSSTQLEEFASGLPIDDRLTSPCQIAPINHRTYRITLSEGRNRQIRRMFEYFGLQVARLHRVRFGPLLLGDLPPGLYRELTPKEEKELHATVGGL